MTLCNPQLSRDLQALGYDGEVTRWYNRNGELKTTHLVDDDVPAPRLDDAAYFIRDRYGISFEIHRNFNWMVWSASIYDINSRSIHSLYNTSNHDYDSALETAVTKAIEIIKDNKP